MKTPDPTCAAAQSGPLLAQPCGWRWGGGATLLGFLALGLLACAAGSEESLSPAQLQEATICACITPGKPDAPTESISAVKQGQGFWLTLQRLDGSGTLLGQERVALPQADWIALWQQLEQLGLRSLKLTPQKSRVQDFGERRLRLEWKVAGSASAGHQDLSWSQPLEAEQAKKVQAIFSRLNALAKAHAKKVALAYFSE